ncbi:unnamed protein product [Cuscuta campestris]|uniref:Thioredoxin-like fold domain-containing protein n=1 Tax=Cuscuta campestris TaxID=132261 RepID=A0A484NLP3_9ASTE|nr:unnamed protein product [Cuscuta campestris]
MDVDEFAGNDGCGGSDSKSESWKSKRLRGSTSDKASSERMMKVLAEKVSFPAVSKARLKQIKVSMLVSLSDSWDSPDPHVPPTLLHKQLVENALESSKKLLGWWFFPFDNTAFLENKIVVLYLYKENETFLADKLAAWYKKISKRKHSSVVEVVAVSIDGCSTSDEYFMDKGWFVCRADPSNSAKLCVEYFHPLFGPHEAVVAFGEDGVIQSIDASHILECQGPPFHGSLREEISQEFEYAGFNYMRHYDYSSFMKKDADEMEVERDVDVFTMHDEIGGSDLESSISKRLRRSTSNKG